MLKPVAKELSESGADDNRDDDVAIEVHGKQHDEIRDAESDGVDDRADDLLQGRRTEDERGGGVRRGETRALLTLAGVCGQEGRPALELAQQVVVVLFARAAEGLQKDDQGGDAEAGRGHHAVVGDSP